jgi:ferrous iron transport protein A
MRIDIAPYRQLRYIAMGRLSEPAPAAPSRFVPCDDETNVCMRLHELPLGRPAVISEVSDLHDGDTVARRLRDLGFVPGEHVRIVGRGPVCRDPLAVQVGHSRFALRRTEAARVLVAAVEDRE